MRIALVHDYLTQYGGAERVLESLHQQWPNASVLTSLYEPENLPPSFRQWNIQESPIARLPGSRHSHRAWFPLYPAIFGQIGRSVANVDIVLADSSAWAHHAYPGSRIPLVVYCHSPARFLYRDRQYLNASQGARALGPLLEAAFTPLRGLDKQAARRATRYIANSRAVARRIKQSYDIESTVIHPPVDIARFTPSSPVPAEDWFLLVSRLVPHKWIDRAIRASNQTGLQLKVIGDGRARENLQHSAGPSVEFLGQLPDEDVVDHMQRCHALILPGIEDFGMTVVEAQAAGRPVIAARGGGALETIQHGATGFLFDMETDGSLARKMIASLSHPWDSDAIQRSTVLFSTEQFLIRIQSELEDVLRNE